MEERIYRELVRGFPKEVVKEREGPWDPVSKKRITFKFIPAPDIVDRLNKAFGYDWSNRIISREVIGDTIVVHMNLSYFDRSSGRVLEKEQFGSVDIKRFSQGQNQGKPIDMGNDFKAAATDALKKCAALFGVALRVESMGDPDYMPDLPDTEMFDEEVVPAPPRRAVTEEQILPPSRAEKPKPAAVQAPVEKVEITEPAVEEDDIHYPKERKQIIRPPRPDYNKPAPEPPPPIKPRGPRQVSQALSQMDDDMGTEVVIPEETPKGIGTDGEKINANQLSVLRSISVRKQRGEFDLMAESLGVDNAPMTFAELTRTDAKKVLSYAYKLPDMEG